MERTITVKGTGIVSAAPDRAVITLELCARSTEYPAAAELAAAQTDELRERLMAAGFSADEIKTANFSVNTEYDTAEENGIYRQVFRGYLFRHSIVVGCGLDSNRLSDALSAVSDSSAAPELSIAFTVKDKEALKDKLLSSAAENARRRAEILCAASGVRLGQLLKIDYSWRDINLYSDTRFEADAACLSSFGAAKRAVNIAPQDIELTDSALFIWEIEGE